MRSRLPALALAALSFYPHLASALPWPGGDNKRGSSGSGHSSDLAATVKRYADYDKCMAELSHRLPVQVTSMILGGQSLQLLCRSHQAAAASDANVCNQLKDYTMRRECQRFAAVFSGKVNECPTQGYPTYREGLCTALAARNPALCLAVAKARRPYCQAMLSGDRHCASLPLVERYQCKGEARAWSGVFKAQKSSLPSTFAPRLEIKATPVTATLKLPPAAAHYKDSMLENGLLVADATGTGDWLGLNTRFAPKEDHDWSQRPPIDLELVVPLSGGGTGTFSLGSQATATVGQVKANFREVGNYRYRQMVSSTGSVIITRFERRLTGRVAGSFTTEVTDGIDKLKIEGTFETFVRELMPLSQVQSYMRYYTNPPSYGNYGRLTPEEVTQTQAKIHKVKDNLYDVDPSVRDDLAKNTSKVTYAASINRRYISGSNPAAYSCYQMYSVQQNTVLYLLGFRDNDIVCKVNKIKLDTPEDVYAAYAKLRKAAKLTVEIERQGSPVTLTFRIKKVKPPKTGATKKKN